MRVAVILSSYNGEKYLREQIDSILAQKGVEVELFIRDDGSCDNSVSILRDFSERYSNVHVRESQNIGFRQSFIRELKCHDGFDFYAFSDQDDYWENEKLSAACNMILDRSTQASPTVYYSNLFIADESLSKRRKTKLEERKQTLQSVTMRRSIAGCTMVMNHAMWAKIAEREISDQMLRRGHDSFVISLCYSLGGTVLCDERAFISYRQHHDNTSGGMLGPRQRIQKEWRALLTKRGQGAEIARAILCSWGDAIPAQSKEVLSVVSTSGRWRSRLRIAFSSDFVTGNLQLTVLGKLKALIGCF